MLARWRERDVFRRSLANREGAEVWSFYEGPPTANGQPGVHHVLARVFKDIFPRYQTMRGYRVPRKAGWDTPRPAGRARGREGARHPGKHEIEDYGIAKFNENCRERVCATSRSGTRSPSGSATGSTSTTPTSPTERLHRVGLVDPQAVLGQGPALRGPQGRAVLPALRHVALLARGRARLQDVQDPSVFVKLRSSRIRGERRPKPATTSSPGRRRPGRCRRTSALAVGAGPRLRAGRRRATSAHPRRGRWLLRQAVLDQYRRGASASGSRAATCVGTALRRRSSRSSPTSRPRVRSARGSRRLRQHRGRHGHRPHRPRVRRGRLRSPAERGIFDPTGTAPSTTRSGRTALRPSEVPATRAAFVKDADRDHPRT